MKSGNEVIPTSRDKIQYSKFNIRYLKEKNIKKEESLERGKLF